MSIFSSVLGLDAANNSQKAAESQSKRNANVAKQAGTLFGQSVPQYQDLLGQLSHFDLGHAIGSAMNLMNQSPQSRVASFANGANERAGQAAQANANFLKSQGYGDGAVMGAGQSLFGDAARQVNAYAANQESPEEQYRRLMALIQAYSGATGAYNNQLSGLAGLIYGQPQVQQVGSPLAGLLGSAAGLFASGATGGATGAIGATGLDPSYIGGAALPGSYIRRTV